MEGGVINSTKNWNKIFFIYTRFSSKIYLDQSDYSIFEKIKYIIYTFFENFWVDHPPTWYSTLPMSIEKSVAGSTTAQWPRLSDTTYEHVPVSWWKKPKKIHEKLARNQTTWNGKFLHSLWKCSQGALPKYYFPSRPLRFTKITHKLQKVLSQNLKLVKSTWIRLLFALSLRKKEERRKRYRDWQVPKMHPEKSQPEVLQRKRLRGDIYRWDFINFVPNRPTRNCQTRNIGHPFKKRSRSEEIQ